MHTCKSYSRFILIALIGLSILGAKEQFDEELYKALEYRNIGPFRGGRSAASTGVPGNKMLAYFGATGGGQVSFDAGATWNTFKSDSARLSTFASMEQFERAKQSILEISRSS